MADNKTEYIISLKDLFSQGIRDADKAAKDLDKSVLTLKNTLTGIVATAGITAISKELFDVTRQMDSLNSSLNFISGGKGNETFAYLTKEADLLGQSLEASANGYKQIAGAARGTNLEGQKTKDIFEGVSMAATVMQLSSEQSEGALLALSQMISKGKVQAEELRGQLGERIPGAFQIAARSMNMTTAQLDKFMADGKLVADNFLPKFAAQLKKEFAGGLAEATQSLTAQTNRLANEYLLLKTDIGNELKPVMFWLIQSLRDLIPITREVIKFIKEHQQAIRNIAWAIGAAALALFLYRTYLLITKAVGQALFLIDMVKYIASTQGLTRATAFMSIAQWDLNAAMAANPVGAVIAAVALLALGIKALIDNYEQLKQEYQDNIQKNHARAIDDETQAVTELAKAYERQGNSAAEARKKAINTEAFNLAQERKNLEQELQLIRKQREQALILDKGDFDEHIRAKEQAIGITAAKQSALRGMLNSASGTTKDALTTKVDTGTNSVKGPEHKVITINIDKLVEKININTTNMVEGVSNIKEIITKALIEALNDSQIVGAG